MFKVLSIALCGLLVSTVSLASAQDADRDETLYPRYKMTTTKGDIVIELNGEKAPVTTLNFDSYVEKKFYDGTIFHRVIPGFMIQGGGFLADYSEKREGLGTGIRNEWRNGLSNKRGTISMARVGNQPNSGRAQFFINVADNDFLDVPRDGAGYAVFGQVVEGMDIADAIVSAETKVVERLNPRSAETPVENIVIESVTRISDINRSKLEEVVATSDPTGPAAISNFINKKQQELNQEPKRYASGLVSFVLKEGNGEQKPEPTNTVEVHYHGTLVDGSVFDSSVNRGEKISFPLNGVIKGWTEGVGDMVVGEKRLFVIPPDLAYGDASPSPAIPPGSTLVFEVELFDIK